jgi:hypothetical protein
MTDGAEDDTEHRRLHGHCLKCGFDRVLWVEPCFVSLASATGDRQTANLREF